MFPTPNHPADPDAYSVTVEPTDVAKGGRFTLDMDGNWERVARAHRPEVINSIAPMAMPPQSGRVVAAVLLSALAVAGTFGMLGWAFSK